MVNNYHHEGDAHAVAFNIAGPGAPPTAEPWLSVRMVPPGSWVLDEVIEGDGPATVWFELLDGSGGNLTTFDATVSFRVITQGGSAEAGVDYEGIDIEVTIPAGDSFVSLDIAIFDDVHIDSSTSTSENFEVMITDVFSGNATLDAEGDSGSVTILDDESGPRRSRGSPSACCRTSAYPAAMPRRGE